MHLSSLASGPPNNYDSPLW